MKNKHDDQTDQIQDKWKNIHSICIISSKNPSVEQEAARHDEHDMEKRLKDGFYAFHKAHIKGEQNEVSFFIYNVSLTAAKGLIRECAYNSFMFISNADIDFLMEIKDKGIWHSTVFEDMENFIDQYNRILENCTEDVDALIAECLDDRLTGRAQYVRRMNLYGKKKQRKDDKQEH